MKIIFMGTPDFAVPSLEILIKSKHEVCAVFCQPDKPKGRGKKMQFPPVKETALQADIPVFQPETLKNADVQAEINEMNADLIVVAAYGKILPKAVLDAPKLGCVNVHGSILPKYRGAAPIQRAVIDGEKSTGVTIMFMGEGLDTGDIISVSETEIQKAETAGELFDRLKVIGAELLIETLEKMEKGDFSRTPQDDTLATHAPMLKKSEGNIDWSKTSEEIYNQIRGLNPWPCAFSFLNGKKLKIYASEILNANGQAGTAAEINGDFIVYCGKGALKLTEIQAENAKRMSGKSYLLGHKLNEDSKFSQGE